MICPTCKKEIVQLIDYSGFNPKYLNDWECPEGHVRISGFDNEINSYTIYLEQDGFMYRLEGARHSGTALAAKKLTHRMDLPYTRKYTIPQFIIPQFKDDVIQIEHIIDKLTKLIVFS